MQPSRLQAFRLKLMKRVYLPIKTTKAPKKANFKVFQWNILADGLAQHGDFVKVPKDLLQWNKRFSLILKEIISSEADIICLQEVNHFEDLRIHLKQLDYCGTFLPKNNSPSEKYHFPPDGIAIFYKLHRYDLLKQPITQTFVDTSGHRQSQCCLGLMLHDKVAKQDIFVVTTHFKAKEGRENDEIRLCQAKQLLGMVVKNLSEFRLSKLQKTVTSQPHSLSLNNESTKESEIDVKMATSSDSSWSLSSFIPVVIAGDFNAGLKSNVCEFFETHQMGFKSVWNVPVADECRPFPVNSQFSTSDSKPNSVFESEEFSTWKFRSKGMSKRIIDYIWFSNGDLGENSVKSLDVDMNVSTLKEASTTSQNSPSQSDLVSKLILAQKTDPNPKAKMTPVQRWKMLTEDEIGPEALPTKTYPSDHVALCCEFAWDISSDLQL
mmetsp:Transcript_7873/g.15341  ORF Transcript_7873/g.15341 Transcript_7873/m.15341 type:complete len:436 (-) Transcript_7873:124-1431(-)